MDGEYARQEYDYAERLRRKRQLEHLPGQGKTSSEE